MILSASCANLSKSVVSVDVRTIQTWDGRRCRNSSHRKDESVVVTLSPNSY